MRLVNVGCEPAHRCAREVVIGGTLNRGSGVTTDPGATAQRPPAWLSEGRPSGWLFADRMGGKPWLSLEERTEIRRALETSARKAQAAIQQLQEQRGVNPIVEELKRRLIVLSTMAERDLKTV